MYCEVETIGIATMKVHYVMKLYPFLEICNTCELLVRKGICFFQQFKCEACDAKQTMAEENHLYMNGVCEECGHKTNLVKSGCNYLAIATIQGVQQNVERRD